MPLPEIVALIEVPSTTTVPSQTTSTTAPTPTTVVDDSGVATITRVIGSGKRITVSWTGGQPNTLFRIRYRIGSGKWSTKYYTSKFEYELTGLQLAKTYRIQVGAKIDGKWPNLWDTAFAST